MEEENVNYGFVQTTTKVLAKTKERERERGIFATPRSPRVAKAIPTLPLIPKTRFDEPVSIRASTYRG